MELFSKIKKAFAAVAAKLSGKKEIAAPANPIVLVKKEPVKKKVGKPKSKKA